MVQEIACDIRKFSVDGKTELYVRRVANNRILTIFYDIDQINGVNRLAMDLEMDAPLAEQYLEREYGIKIFPWTEPKTLHTNFRFYVDDEMPAMAAYHVNWLNNGEPICLFNMEASIHHYKQEKEAGIEDRVETFKNGLLQTLTHEFCHAMQEWLGLSYDEYQVEKILAAYDERWNALEAAEPEEKWDPQFRISEMLAYLEDWEIPETFVPDEYCWHYEFGVDLLKKDIRQLFSAVTAWQDADKKHAEDVAKAKAGDTPNQ